MYGGTLTNAPQIMGGGYGGGFGFDGGANWLALLALLHRGGFNDNDCHRLGHGIVEGKIDCINEAMTKIHVSHEFLKQFACHTEGKVDCLRDDTHDLKHDIRTLHEKMCDHRHETAKEFCDVKTLISNKFCDLKSDIKDEKIATLDRKLLLREIKDEYNDSNKGTTVNNTGTISNEQLIVLVSSIVDAKLKA